MSLKTKNRIGRVRERVVDENYFCLLGLDDLSAVVDELHDRTKVLLARRVDQDKNK